MKEIPLTKHNRMERMMIACVLLTSIWNEVRDCEAGDIESGLLQNAVYAQVDINRIVWKLNELNGCKPQTESTGSPIGDYRDGVGAWQTDCGWAEPK